MSVFKRIISHFCPVAMVFVLVLSTFTIASAYTQGDLIVDTDSVNAWELWMDANIAVQGDELSPQFWNCIDNSFNACGYGALSSHTEIVNAMETWNGRMHRFSLGNLAAIAAFMVVTASKDIPTAYVAFDSELGVYRLREYHTDLWLVNSAGHFPYYAPPTDEDGNVPAVDNTGIQWLPYADAFQNQNNRHFVTKDVLDDFSDYYNGVVIKQDKYYVVTTTDPVLGTYLFLCDPHGYPYVNVVDPESTAVNTPNNWYTDPDQTITQNNQLIDLNQNVVWFPDGTMQYIDSLIYDESTQSYYVDSHDTYNFINDSYNTYNYHWEYNYYIDYTSITYIGQTEEYEDPYICYYELPDGRSSADLTKEELEQLSLVFVDVINYARSADDTNMRLLYHFDGNLEDSSYWSYCTSFDWAEGASITYMDEGTFNGSLYLDEDAHEFTLTLPNADMGGDFTLQFRYYQSYTPTPAADSMISLGTEQIFVMDGVNFYDRLGSALCVTPIGNWIEICIMREYNVVYYYVNGVCYGTLDLKGSFGRTITFTFGGDQNTYKKLDELRFTKAALYNAGEDYTPTAVPYDTNLALVLPDGEVPIADEYYTITAPDDNILAQYDFTKLSTLNVTEFAWNYTNNITTNTSAFQTYANSIFDTYGLYTFGNTVTLTQGESGVVMSVEDPSVIVGTDVTIRGSTSGTSFITANDFPLNSLALCLSVDGSYVSSSDNGLYNISIPQSGATAKTYCLTVIDTDGNVSYINFYSRLGSVSYFIYTDYLSTTFDFSIFGGFRLEGDTNNKDVRVGEMLNTGYTYYYGGASALSFVGPVFLAITPVNGSVEIAYMELVEGTAPEYKMTWHNAVYSSGQLEESPVLAVKSSTEVTSWQIGGVRPSYPEKGQVWALVENGRITSLQQYTGYAWISVDGRIWTGERWIPPASFDVFTMQDFWDMVGTSGDDYTYIYTESGFWDWWQKQWYQFTGTLFDKMDDIDSGTNVDIDIEADVLLDPEDKDKFDGNEYKGIVKTMRNIYDFVADFFTDFTMGGIQDFLDVLNDKNSFIYGLFKLSGLG